MQVINASIIHNYYNKVARPCADNENDTIDTPTPLSIFSQNNFSRHRDVRWGKVLTGSKKPLSLKIDFLSPQRTRKTYQQVPISEKKADLEKTLGTSLLSGDKLHRRQSQN